MTRIPPTEAIDDSPTVCVQINKQWVSHVMGRLDALTQSWFWSGDENTVYDATQEAEKLMTRLALGSEACMVPVGAIMAWPSATPPENWLICDGGSRFVADFPDLFSLIGYNYGGIDDVFYLPNLVNRMPVGAEGTYPLASTGGAATVTLTTAQLPAHSHNISTRISATAGTGERLMRATGAQTELTATQDAGGGQSHNNMPPYLALHYIIRAS